MKLPKIVESLLFVTLFCSLLGCTFVLMEHLQAKIGPQTILGALRFFKKTPSSPKNIPSPQALFDGQRIKKTLLGLLDKAEQNDTISITAFIVTDAEIAQALIKKHLQGITVNIVVDNGHALKDYSKVPDLIKAGISVYLHNPSSADIMHNKFWCLNYKNAHPVVVTGSYNLTNSAATKNAENIVLISHPETFKEYSAQFSVLVENSIRAEVPKAKKTHEKIDQKTIESILKANGLPV